MTVNTGSGDKGVVGTEKTSRKRSSSASSGSDTVGASDADYETDSDTERDSEDDEKGLFKMCQSLKFCVKQSFTVFLTFSSLHYADSMFTIF